MKMRIKALFCLVCLLCLSVCGKGQEIGVESQTESQAESTAEDQTEPEVETLAETQEEASSDRTHYQNRCPAIGDVDWEAYQRILSDEDYAVLQDYFSVLREEVPFTWTANAYYDEDEAEKRTVTLDEFFYILNNELIWDDDSDESWLDSIAFCDLDRDGGMELILSLASIDGHYLILKEESGQYYGTDKVYRGFEALQTNGVYVSSDGAEDNYFLQMCFEDGAFREIFLGRVYYGAYYMGDVETADEEVFQEWLEGILSGDVLYYKPQAKNESSPAEDIFAQIHNEEEYQALVGQLEECTGYFGVRLDMVGSDIPIYLDDLMARRNLTYLTIENGGRITARYMIALGTGSIKYLSLHRVLVGEEELNHEKVYYREIGQEYFPEFDFYWYG